MRILHLLDDGSATELTELPARLPDGGMLWLSTTHDLLAAHWAPLQDALARWAGAALLDLHAQELLHAQLPPQYDYTAHYDLLVFHCLAPDQNTAMAAQSPTPRRRTAAQPPRLARIETRAMGFAVFERLLLSVHPDGDRLAQPCARRLLDRVHGCSASAALVGARAQANPADLMLQLVGLAVKEFLDLRRQLTRQLEQWQEVLLNPRSRFSNWHGLLEARLTLHQLEDLCEDQRTALRAWLAALETLPTATLPAQAAVGTPRSASSPAASALDLLKMRSRDVLEHLDRVVHHVRRLGQSAETAVQMHFSVQGHRTNSSMRTLTALTAVFLPLNLIAGIFGMNFDVLPLVHHQGGFWWAMAGMALMAAALVVLFWRKRYLRRLERC